MTSQTLELVFTSTGGVELENPRRGTVLWASDDDDDFRDHFNDEVLSPDEDAARVIEWLVESGIINEDEAEALDVMSEGADMEDDPDKESGEFEGHTIDMEP
jgi:hypothetical protein